ALVKQICAAALLGVLAFALYRPAKAAAGKAKDAGESRLELIITGMHCNQCVEVVSRVLLASPGVASANVNLKTGKAIISGDDFDLDVMRRGVAELGYQLKEPDGKENHGSATRRSYVERKTDDAGR
ncbi:MAG: heavy-metal-associated domain-containing protein, partial [Phycisphaerae bacterium]|nr:heavy-metal-associated domain-containing protein [Phycisphaerae bacterium]